MAFAQLSQHLVRTLTDLVADGLTKWQDGEEHQPDVGVRCPKADDCQRLHGGESGITCMSLERTSVADILREHMSQQRVL
jgi:hypothetical protein